MSPLKLLATAAFLSLAIAGCGSTTSTTCDAGAALADGACPADNPIVGTWSTSTVSADDTRAGVVSNTTALTYMSGGAFSFTDNKTYNATAVGNANCAEALAGSGTYTLSGSNTIAMMLSGATVTRTNCLDPAQNVSNQALTTAQLAYLNTFLAALNTYTVSGTLLTLSNTTDGGTSGAGVFTRTN